MHTIPLLFLPGFVSVYGCYCWILRAKFIFTILHRIELFMCISCECRLFGKSNKCTLGKSYEMRFWNGCVIFGIISSLSVSLTGFNTTVCASVNVGVVAVGRSLDIWKWFHFPLFMFPHRNEKSYIMLITNECILHGA